MGLLRLTGFSGMWPIRDARALPDNAAVVAQNVLNDGGAYLKGSRQQNFLFNLLASTRTIFRIPLGPSTDLFASHLMQFADENTTVVRGPLVNDSFERYYWGSPSEGLKYQTLQNILNGVPGFILGVPAPVTAPSVAEIVGGTAPVVTRSYVVTFVNIYGEESGPSPPAEEDGNANASWTVTFPVPTAVTGYAPYEKTIIYRTLTGDDGVTDFYRVGEVPPTTSIFVDTVPDTDLITVLETTSWDAPPAGTQGLAAMPNGILVTWKDNTLYFSENWHPHVWPTAYALTVDYPIVGVGVYGNSLVVCTNGNPSIVSGTRSAGMSLQKTDAPLACVARRSIAAGAEGIFYASEDGLVLVSPGNSVQTVTKDLISREQWRNDYAPYSFKAMYQDGFYTAIRATGFLTDVIRFMPSNPSDAGVVAINAAPLNFGVDPWSGKPWVIDTDHKLYEWEAPTGVRRDYSWRSREFIYPRPTNFKVYQAYFDDTPNSNLHCRIWVTVRGNNGSLKRRMIYDQKVKYSGREILLPSGFKGDIWQFEFSGQAILQSFQIATTVAELRGA